MEDEKFIAILDEKFAKVDEQFAKVDEQFAKVDQRFAKVDERFEKVDEQFRQSAMNSERIENELSSMRTHMKVLDVRIERLTNEITLPSGRVAQQFASAQAAILSTRALIEQLDGKIVANGEQMDLISDRFEAKLEAFRAETSSRLDVLESTRR